MKWLPSEVRAVMSTLEKEGYEAYVVGGAVRNFLLNLESDDYDLCTDARPEEVLRIFGSQPHYEVGKRFGTVGVLWDGVPIEITTFRTESGYGDYRHPSEIVFSESLEEDLSRRDFTVNAMAYNEKRGIIDLYDGRKHLAEKTVVAVGDADCRIGEDVLRILRGIRFATVLGFDMDENLVSAGRRYAPRLSEISAERIAKEMEKILVASSPSRGIRMMSDCGVLEVLLPEIAGLEGFDQHSSNHRYDLLEHTLHVVDGTPADEITRWAALFHDTGKPETFFIGEDGEGHFYGHQKISAGIAVDVLRRYKLPTKKIKSVEALIQRHMDCMNAYTKRSVKRLIARLGPDDVMRLFDLQLADIRATVHDEETDNVCFGRALAKEILEGEEAVDEKGLVIDGHDLKALGYRQGRVLGKALKELTTRVIDGDLPNERESLLQYAKKLYEGEE